MARHHLKHTDPKLKSYYYKLDVLNKPKEKLDILKNAKIQFETNTAYRPTWQNGKGYQFGSGKGLYSYQNKYEVHLNVEPYRMTVTKTSINSLIDSAIQEYNKNAEEIMNLNKSIECFNYEQNNSQIIAKQLDLSLKTIDSTIFTPYPSWKQTLQSKQNALSQIKKARTELIKYGLPDLKCGQFLESPLDIAFTHNEVMNIFNKPKLFSTKSEIDKQIASLQIKIDNPSAVAGQRTKNDVNRLRRNQSIQSQLKGRGVMGKSIIDLSIPRKEKEKIEDEKRIIEENRIKRELEKELEEKRIKEAEILRLENLEKLEQIQKDLEAQQNSFIEPVLVENLFKDVNLTVKDMGKPKSVFNTQEKNVVPETVTPVGRTDKPVSVSNQNEISQNQTSISDISEDLSADLENFLDFPIFKNDDNKIKNVSYQVTPLNFKVLNGRIIGSVNISSSELTNEKTVLHASFFPLDLKQNKLGEKINTLNFNKDLNETIEINESSKNYENVSMNLHVMNPKTKEHLSQEVNIDVLKSDSQDMPEKDKKDNTSMYVVAGIGLVALALILKKVRKGDKN